MQRCLGLQYRPIRLGVLAYQSTFMLKTIVLFKLFLFVLKWHKCTPRKFVFFYGCENCLMNSRNSTIKLLPVHMFGSIFSSINLATLIIILSGGTIHFNIYHIQKTQIQMYMYYQRKIFLPCFLPISSNIYVCWYWFSFMLRWKSWKDYFET